MIGAFLAIVRRFVCRGLTFANAAQGHRTLTLMMPGSRANIEAVPAKGAVMTGPWEADTNSGFRRRLGKSMKELGGTMDTDGCPDIWELDNGDIAVIGREATDAYARRLPAGVTIRADERLLVIPRSLLVAAKPDIPDA